MTQGKKSLINPVSGGLIALLILGVVLYILFAAEPKSSEDEFSHQDATHIADSNSQEKKLDEYYSGCSYFFNERFFKERQRFK